MTQVCSQCAAVNPPEAAFCYFDGVLLAGHAGGMAAPPQLFPNQFVFPNGQACRSFDQLAVCCQQNWALALDMLKQGYLAGFLGSIGRADLATAAQEAARFPDPDRGLDQFLSRLPARGLQPPKLTAAPKEVHLGQLRVGVDRRLDIHLANQGMRLLYGSVASDCGWLSLGDTPGSSQKLFQCGDETTLTVNVRGQHLRAGIKTLEGRLLVDSNGGTAEVVIRADVPVTPFPEGVLAGAVSPRQVAEKAKAAPKEAAALFESGAVAQWFQRNGWTYPVQGPAGRGLGAVQQFFEALGLSAPPKVAVNPQIIRLSGAVGASVQQALEVRAEERRPVYAHAVADQPWLEVGGAEYRGRVAVLRVKVNEVPDRPGETLQGKVTVRANGNQRFDVAVSLTVAANGWGFLAPRLSAPPTLEAALPVALPLNAVSAAGELSVAASLPIPTSVEAGRFAPAPALVLAPPPLPPSPIELHPAAPPRPRGTNGHTWIHILPSGLLLLALVGVMARDVLVAGTPSVGADGIPVDRRPLIRLGFEDGLGEMRDSQSMRFGIAARVGRDWTRLTFHEQGATNNTVLRVNGQERIFGHAPGRWKERATPVAPGFWGAKDGKQSTWVYDEHVEVSQIVEVVPGDAIEVAPGKLQRAFDTGLIRYRISNRGGAVQNVGVRILLDLKIGGADGVPFVVPGDPLMCDTFKAFNDAASVPDFLLALEHPNLQQPGTVARLGLKGGLPVEPPSRVLLTHWPDRRVGGGERMQGWEVPLVSMKQFHDSAVALYWDEKPLPPGETREVGFTYGLGSLSASSSGSLGLTVHGDLHAEGQFSVVALVNNPKQGQSLTLSVEDGLTPLPGFQATQWVAHSTAGTTGQINPVTWRVQALKPGRFRVAVQSSTGETVARTVVIRPRSIS
jgi:hypothetical protein